MILDRYRAGTLGFTPIHLGEYLRRFPPAEEVEVHRGAWNTEHHHLGDVGVYRILPRADATNSIGA